MLICFTNGVIDVLYDSKTISGIKQLKHFLQLVLTVVHQGLVHLVCLHQHRLDGYNDSHECVWGPSRHGVWGVGT